MSIIEPGTSEDDVGTHITAGEGQIKVSPTFGKLFVFGFVYVTDCVAHDFFLFVHLPCAIKEYCCCFVKLELFALYCNTFPFFSICNVVACAGVIGFIGITREQFD